jgi:hypothetical protein
MGRRPCQPANRARWTRKRMWLPKGATKRKRRRPSILEGFVFSGSILIAAQMEFTLGYDQSHASLRYLIARTRTANAGGQRRQADGSPLVRWHWCLRSPGRSTCHPGKETREICIQLAAPDAQSNAAKEEKFYDRVHLEQTEASLHPRTTGSTR